MYHPEFSLTLYDSDRAFNANEIACENHRAFHLLPNTNDTIIAIAVDTFAMEDSVHSLSGQCAQPLHQYNYYDARAQSSEFGTPFQSQECDDTGTTCLHQGVATLDIHMASPLVMQQKSDYGTSTLQILFDEGSIVGAVLFFAWILSNLVI